MKWTILISILSSWIICSQTSLAQHISENQELEQLSRLFPVKEKKQQEAHTIRFDNEIQLILTGSFAFYKRFISPQDALHCSFYPSCSAYALKTLQENRLLGIFDAIDRLTRCNGFSPEKYQLYHQGHLFYDPVQRIH